ncbi:hypothetical protein [Azospirillum thermophilum]|uniref:Uncharacterized protein n=1 Tax=Azospirillum thermophilum TaxID=2202148 RepID=A0A2S2CKX2_9PROT|nr:hypothetical protein [Azospirillum thermophilum]AWK85079.1 hypothetical protein DEW08_01775 [Azospirillum thermophilum]
MAHALDPDGRWRPLGSFADFTAALGAVPDHAAAVPAPSEAKGAKAAAAGAVPKAAAPKPAAAPAKPQPAGPRRPVKAGAGTAAAGV